MKSIDNKSALLVTRESDTQPKPVITSQCRYLGFGSKVHECASIVNPQNLFLDDFSIIDAFVFALASGQIHIGKFVHLASHSTITGGKDLKIGNFTEISGGSRIITGIDDHDRHALPASAGAAEVRNAGKASVEIGNFCIIGANSIILPGVKIGHGVIVTPGTIVKENLMPWHIYSGSECKCLGIRAFRREIIAKGRETVQGLSNFIGKLKVKKGTATNNNRKRIYLSPPHLDGREHELLQDAYKSNWITTLGPHVDAFEYEISQKVNVPYAAALSSGTSAIHMALINLGVAPGDEVLCSTFTFSASANPIVYCGGTPVFIDSNRETWNMDPFLLEEELEACSQRGKLPKAIIAVDLYGQCADYDRILRIAGSYGVPVIEDAAEALGATYHGKFAGSFGEMGIFSFNGNKIITTSGGGMIISKNKAYIDHARFLSTQARDPFPYYQHSHVGHNYRLSNLLAAIGRGQLENLDKKVARKREINALYRAMLKNVPGIKFMPQAIYGCSSCWLTCITIDPEEFGTTNEKVRLALEEQNIESRRVWKPMHRQPVFAHCRVRGGAVSDEVFAEGLCLPSGTGMTDDDLRRVVQVIVNVGGCPDEAPTVNPQKHDNGNGNGRTFHRKNGMGSRSRLPKVAMKFPSNNLVP